MGQGSPTESGAVLLLLPLLKAGVKKPRVRCWARGNAVSEVKPARLY